MANFVLATSITILRAFTFNRTTLFIFILLVFWNLTSLSKSVYLTNTVPKSQ